MYTKKIETGTGLYQGIGKGCNLKKSSMSLNKLRKNLNKATTVAAIIGIATCLFPALAQAQIRVFNSSGKSPIETTPDGFIDPSSLQFITADLKEGTSEVPVNDSDVLLGFSVRAAEDVNSLDSQGEFPGSIQSLTVKTNNENLNLSLSSGTLRSSRLAVDPTTGNFPGLSFGYQAITDNNYPYAVFNNDGLRYDFTFDNRSETLTLFIPSSFLPPIDPNSVTFRNGVNINDPINSTFFISGLLTRGVQGVVRYPELGIEQRLLVTGAQRVFTQRGVTVPEPTAPASLLGVAALGAVSLLKRNQRLRKAV